MPGMRKKGLSIRAGRGGGAREVSWDQTIQGLVGSDLGDYPKSNGQPRSVFKEVDGDIRQQ